MTPDAEVADSPTPMRNTLGATECAKRPTILTQQRERRSRMIKELAECEKLISTLEKDNYLARKLEEVRDAIW